MKRIPLSKAKASLGKYGRMCQKEEIVVTIKGVPSFQLAPLDNGEDTGDFLRELYNTNASFRQLVDRRKKEPGISSEEMRRRLGLSN